MGKYNPMVAADADGLVVPQDIGVGWHSKYGKVELSDMDTQHLYNALKMLWNHSVEPEYIIHPFRNRYVFDDDKYSENYIVSIIPQMVIELSGRLDKSCTIKTGLHHMMQALRVHSIRTLLK